MSTPRDECPRLLSLAVHEFRTPVTVMAGYVRMFLKIHGANLDEQARKLLEEAEKSCGRLSGLIAELSDLSHLESGHLALERRTIELFPLLAEVAASVHEGTDRGIRLDTVPTAERAVIDGDRPRLSEALTTLFSATIRERAEPGEMVGRWGVGPGDDAPTAWVALAPRDSETSLDGFHAADWGPFEQWRGGLGFRLVMAREVIAAHGGTLYSGRGTAARAACALTFPVKESSW